MPKPFPTDIEILTAIDSLEENEDGRKPLDNVLSQFPDVNHGALIKRLGKLSMHDSDVLAYVPGNHGGYKITGDASHASDVPTAKWILQWSEDHLGI